MCDHVNSKKSFNVDVPVADPETGEFKGCFDRELCWDCGDYSVEIPTLEVNCKHRRSLYNEL